jgi:outer membrane receptor protein involved in Fe transport
MPRRFNIKGNQMLRVPEYKADAYAQYAWPVPGDRGTLTFLVDYSYIDDVFFDVFENPEDQAPDYSRVDARITWLSSDTSWTVAAFVNNIFDDIGIRQIEASDESQDFRRGGTLDQSADVRAGSSLQIRRFQIGVATDD